LPSYWSIKSTTNVKPPLLTSKSVSSELMASSLYLTNPMRHPRQIRDCHQQGDQRRINQIIDQLVEMFSNTSNALHVRNGGLIGLAGTAIALGVDIAPYMGIFLEPLLNCFTDSESRIRYFSAECLYNISKVSKGEVLVYFNPIFDALSKVSIESSFFRLLLTQFLIKAFCGLGSPREERSRTA
jgi:hypothetical protein